MRKIKSHMVGIDSGEINLFSDFENGGEMWTGEGPREKRRFIHFSEPFMSAPSVSVGISLWDTDAGTNLRMDITADGIKPEGFYAVFRTWGDTKVARVRMSWQAIGQVADPEDAWVLE